MPVTRVIDRCSSIVAAVMFVSIIGGCCSRINLEAFHRQTLEAQIAQYKEARSRGCMANEHLGLLSEIADHGHASADAMLELVVRRDAAFPLSDIAIVADFADAAGTDIRANGLLDALRYHAINAAADERESVLRSIQHIDNRKRTRS